VTRDGSCIIWAHLIINSHGREIAKRVFCPRRACGSVLKTRKEHHRDTSAQKASNKRRQGCSFYWKNKRFDQAFVPSIVPSEQAAAPRPVVAFRTSRLIPLQALNCYSRQNARLCDRSFFWSSLETKRGQQRCKKATLSCKSYSF